MLVWARRALDRRRVAQPGGRPPAQRPGGHAAHRRDPHRADRLARWSPRASAAATRGCASQLRSMTSREIAHGLDARRARRRPHLPRQRAAQRRRHAAACGASATWSSARPSRSARNTTSMPWSAGGRAAAVPADRRHAAPAHRQRRVRRRAGAVARAGDRDELDLHARRPRRAPAWPRSPRSRGCTPSRCRRGLRAIPLVQPDRPPRRRPGRAAGGQQAAGRRRADGPVRAAGARRRAAVSRLGGGLAHAATAAAYSCGVSTLVTDCRCGSTAASSGSASSRRSSIQATRQRSSRKPGFRRSSPTSAARDRGQRGAVGGGERLAVAEHDGHRDLGAVGVDRSSATTRRT